MAIVNGTPGFTQLTKLNVTETLLEDGNPIAAINSNVTDGQVLKFDEITGILVFAGATVDPITGVWTFDESIVVPPGSIQGGQQSITFGYNRLNLKNAFRNDLAVVSNQVRDLSVTDGFGRIQQIETNDEREVTIQPSKVLQSGTGTFVFALFQTPNPAEPNALGTIDNKFTVESSVTATDVSFDLYAANSTDPALTTEAAVVAAYGPPMISERNISVTANVETDIILENNPSLDTFQFFYAVVKGSGNFKGDDITFPNIGGGPETYFIPFIKGTGVDVLVSRDVLDSRSLVSMPNNYINLNDEHITVSAQTGGLVVNYLPTATSDTVTSGQFTKGVAAISNPMVITDTAAVFSTGDIVLVTKSRQNNGFYEVLSHVVKTLSMRGVGVTATVEDFSKNDFVTMVDTATITKINIAVLRINSSGDFEHAKGSNTPMVFSSASDAAGPLNAVQFNSPLGSFAGSANLTFDGTLMRMPFDSSTKQFAIGSSDELSFLNSPTGDGRIDYSGSNNLTLNVFGTGNKIVADLTTGAGSSFLVRDQVATSIFNVDGPTKLVGIGSTQQLDMAHDGSDALINTVGGYTFTRTDTLLNETNEPNGIVEFKTTAAFANTNDIKIGFNLNNDSGGSEFGSIQITSVDTAVATHSGEVRFSAKRNSSTLDFLIHDNSGDVFTLGTADNTTSFRVHDSGAAPMFQVDGTGRAAVNRVPRTDAGFTVISETADTFVSIFEQDKPSGDAILCVANSATANALNASALEISARSTASITPTLRIFGQFSDITDATRDSKIEFQTFVNGVKKTPLKFDDVDVTVDLFTDTTASSFKVTDDSGNTRLAVNAFGEMALNRDPVAGVELFVDAFPDSNNDSFIEIGDNSGARLRLGQRLTSTPASSLAAEITTDSNGDLQYISRSTLNASQIWYTGNPTPTRRMKLSDLGALSLGPANAALSSIFDVQSTTLGSLPAPRMTTTQRDAIATPATGLQVFNTTTNMLQFFDGSIWGDVGGMASFRVRVATAVSTNTTALGVADFYAVTDTSAVRTITISTADVVDGRTFIFKDESGAAGTNNITIDTEGAETIDGAASVLITVNYGAVKLYSDGSNIFSW